MARSAENDARCPLEWCAYPMPHEHTTATASAELTVDEASGVYAHALADYEAALVSRDSKRRATTEALLQSAARALSQAQSRRAARRQRGSAIPSWDDLLSDPTQQLDPEGVVIRSVIPPEVGAP